MTNEEFLSILESSADAVIQLREVTPGDPWSCEVHQEEGFRGCNKGNCPGKVACVTAAKEALEEKYGKNFEKNPAFLAKQREYYEARGWAVPN